MNFAAAVFHSPRVQDLRGERTGCILDPPSDDLEQRNDFVQKGFLPRLTALARQRVCKGIGVVG